MAQFKVTETQQVPEQSRPSIVIDEPNGEISIYTNDTNGAQGIGSGTPDSLPNLATAPLVPVSPSEALFSDLIARRGGDLGVRHRDPRAQRDHHTVCTAPRGRSLRDHPGTVTVNQPDLQWQLTNVGGCRRHHPDDLAWPSAVAT